MKRREFISFTYQAALLWPLNRIHSSSRVDHDVRMFGARGDGRTDDSVAFLDALRAAATDRGSVVVPSGRYVLRQSLALSSGVSIVGRGPQSILDWSTGTQFGLVVSGVSDVGVSSLAIRGSLSWGVLIEHSTRFAVDGCHISGGRVPHAGYCGGVLVAASSGVRISNGVFAGNGTAGAPHGSDIQCNGYGTGTCSDIAIAGNACTSQDVAFNICCFDSDHVRVENNRVSGARTGPANNEGYGIVLYGTSGNPRSSHDNSVLENNVEKTDGSGIYLVRGLASRVVGNSVRTVAFNQGDGTLPVGGIVLNDSEGVSIEGNHVDAAGKAGIAVSVSEAMATSTRIVDNVISRTDRAGIHLRGPVSGVGVIRNRLHDTRGGIIGDSPLGQSDVVIAENQISSTRGESAGIELAKTQRTRVEQNSVEDAGGFGIDVGDPNHDLTISDNHVISYGARAHSPVEAVRVRVR